MRQNIPSIISIHYFSDPFNFSIPAFANTHTSMKTLIIKSLLASLCQREVMHPSFPHSGGFTPRAGRRGDEEAKAKRGKGRFLNNDAVLKHFLVSMLFHSFRQILRR